MSKFRRLGALALASLAAMGATSASAAAPLAAGLQILVHDQEVASPHLARHLGLHVADKAGNPLVHVQLQKGIDTAKVLRDLQKAGLRIHAVSRIDGSRLEGFVPLRLAKALAAVGGVKSISAVPRPMRFAGSVQSQAVAFEKADIAQSLGADGTGIRIAALSDSYDACSSCITHAADDIATGDLPGSGVTVLADLPAGGGEDEGRAMLQLIHDVAPGAQLGFATAFNGEVDFSNQILALRETFGADVIVDDVYYFDEPLFSDGLLAQTVDQVVAEGATYFSSAGNNGLQGWQGTFKPVSFADAEGMVASGQGNLKLDQIPEALRPKFVHLFSGNTPVGQMQSLAQRISTAADNRISFQWDEPFYMGKVKTDYNVYLFDKDGNWLDPLTYPYVYYSTDDNTQTDAAYEFIEMLPASGDIHGGANVTDYQMVIGRMNDGPATQLKYVVENGLAISLYENAPTTGGHAAARHGQGVAAQFYAIPNFPEDFSSPGPVRIYYDANGNRLAKPEIRQVPQITGADGVDTTFFGYDADGTGHPNFFGTSAAAPDVAAVAGLVLQAAGGSGSMAPADVYSVLQRTAKPIPLPNDRSHASARVGAVTFGARGNWTRWEDYFGLSLDAGASSGVHSITFDTADTGLIFSATLARFYVGDSQGVAQTDITVSETVDQKQYTLTFAPGSFTAGEAFRFGTSMYNPIQGSTQLDPDRMRGMKVTVTMEDGTTQSGTVTAPPPLKVNDFTGHGLVDAAKAVKAVAPR